MTRLGDNGRRVLVKGRLDPFTGAPQCGRLDARGWRKMLSDRLEHLTDEAIGRPVRETDAPSRPADPQHLAACTTLIGAEHGAECRSHSVERAVSERKMLGVG